MDDPFKNQGIHLAIGRDNTGNIAIGHGIRQANQLSQETKGERTLTALPEASVATFADLEQEQQQRLFQVLSGYFSEGELRELCFELAIAYEDLPGEGRRDKARELVAYAGRHNRLGALERAVRQIRPHAFATPSLS